ncbi:MAG: lipoprotein [Bacteroidales bacterium]|nr:lipoprotein [Bacteroidales bacterium]
MKKILIALALITLLSSCNQRKEVLFNGNVWTSSASGNHK